MGKVFFTSQLINKYASKFNKIICIGSDLENVENIDIERNDSFDPFKEELTGENLIIFDDIIFNSSIIKIASLLLINWYVFGFIYIFEIFMRV